MPRPSDDSLLARLRQVLATQAPNIGDRLPAERDLAAQLGCSREALRKRLTLLETEGQIWRHVGQGTFRGPRPRNLPVRDTLLVEGAAPPDLMRARFLLEPIIAAEAARSATATDVALLRVRVQAGRIAQDTQACETADDAFHRALAQVSGNPVLIGVLAYLSDARRRAAWQHEWGRTYRRIGVNEFRHLHSDQHSRIVDAVARSDPDAAALAMTQHLNTIGLAMAGHDPSHRP